MARGYTLTQTGSEVQEILNDEPTKQDGLVSGENIKTINNQSILGSGNLNIAGIDHETDPTVPNWAKQPNKPSYTASEVGAVPTTRTVNGKALSSDINLTASDVNALPSSTSIPDALSDLSDDSTHRLVTDTEKTTWNGKQDSISDLATIRNGASAGATAYQKPSTGIPASDLASGVIPDVSQFITKSVNDLANYYTKSQTYTQSEVNSLISGIVGFEYEVVTTLPTASSSTMHKIYLIPSSDPQTQNVKDEYITIQNGSTYSWEQIGSTAIDLSGYVTTTALNNALADYTTTADLNTLLAGYQTKIDATHKLDYSLVSNTPTKVSDFTNDSGFIATETDPVFSASPAYGITSTDITKWDAAAVVADDDGSATTPDFDAEADTVWHKAQTLSSAQKTQARTNIGAQEALVSGTNIKTINNESILGSGNITIQGGSGGGEANVIESISINGTTQTVTSKNVDLPVPISSDVYSIVKLTQSAYDALATKDSSTLYIIVES